MAPTQILASTTDTPEEVQAALAQTPETPAADPSAPPPVAPDAPETPAEAPPVEPDKDDDDDLVDDAAASKAGQTLARRRADHIQKRIDKLVTRDYDSRRALEDRDKEIADLRRQLAATQAAPPVAEPGEATEPPPPPVEAAPPAPEVDPDETGTPEPNLDDFDSVQEHTRAMAKWVLEEDKRQGRLDAKRRDAEQRHAVAFKDHQDRFVASRDAARARHTDWQTVMESARNIMVPDMLRVEIQDSEAAGELLYHFATHPGDLDEILSLHPNVGLRKLGVLEARLLAQSETSAPAAAPTRNGARPLSVSHAPEPPATVGGNSTATGQSMDTMNYQDFKRARAAQQAQRR